MVPGVHWMKAPARFTANVDSSGGPRKCWPWTGGRFARGYGRFHLNGRNYIASRYALELSLGRPLGEGMDALHTCDNPPCVNPRHLYEGTHADNMADKVARGRQPRGELSGTAKLTEQQVRAIRASTESSRKIAPDFGVHDSTIRRIRSGKKWRHIAN